MKPATRSRSGQPRDLDGRFIKGGAKVKEMGPVQAMRQVVAPVQFGSRVGAAVSGRIHQVQAVAEQEADLDSEQQASSDENEVSCHESEECDHVSSDANSDEEDEEVEEARNQDPDLCLAEGGLLADQVFDQMPQPCPSVSGQKLGAAGNVKVQEGADGDAQVAPWVNLFKDNRNLGKGIKLDEWEVDGDLVMLEEEDVMWSRRSGVTVWWAFLQAGFLVWQQCAT